MPSSAPVIQQVVYPALETRLIFKTAVGEVSHPLESCCFHDLMTVSDEELAGMGLAIIGNLCKQLSKDIFNQSIFASLTLKRSAQDDGIACPWPGMPDDSPVPLDLTQMPFQSAMFLDADQLKWRVDRLQLMNRIQAVWLPWLKGKMNA